MGSQVTSHKSQVTGWLLLVGAMVCGAATATAATTAYEKLTDQLAQVMETCRKHVAQLTGYDVVFRRDPMRPLVDEEGRLVTSAGLHGGLSVQGIIWSDEKPLVVIDDELFAQGADLGPYKILLIRPDGLVARRGQDFVFIPLDRGLETQEERPVTPISLVALPEDVPAPYAPHRSPVIIESGSWSVVPLEK